MNILLVTQQTIPHIGGLSTHVETLVNGLTAKKHRVCLLHGGMIPRISTEKVLRALLSFGDRDKLSAGSFQSMLKMLSSAVDDHVKSFRPDVIHCHDVYSASASIPTAKEYGIPIVQTVHGPALYEAKMGGVDKNVRLKEIIMKCEKSSFEKVRHFIAVDSGQAEILRNDYGIADDRISVIFNCVNVDEVRSLSTGTPMITVDHPYLLVPRRLVEKNGVRYAIEAMAHIKHKDVELLIAGDGPLRAELENLSERLGLTGRVHFLGGVSRAELMPLFAKAACVIVPSVPTSGVVEATSLAVTEAMAVGSVPIASNIGGLSELIENGRTGILVKPGDAVSLAAGIDSIVGESDFRNMILESARIKVEMDYSMDAWLSKIMSVYSLVLDKEAV